MGGRWGEGGVESDNRYRFGGGDENAVELDRGGVAQPVDTDGICGEGKPATEAGCLLSLLPLL